MGPWLKAVDRAARRCGGAARRTAGGAGPLGAPRSLLVRLRVAAARNYEKGKRRVGPEEYIYDIYTGLGRFGARSCWRLLGPNRCVRISSDPADVKQHTTAALSWNVLMLPSKCWGCGTGAQTTKG